MSPGNRLVVLLLGVVLTMGCTRPILRDYAQPSRTKDQYLRINRVAMFPFENYSDTKDAEKTVDALLTTAILEEGVFDEVEDTRFVRDAMRKLKITATDILDKEIIKKLGDEMNVQAVLYGKIIAFGKGKEKDAASQVTMDMVMLEPLSGMVLWTGNVSVYGGLTIGKVFGVTEGKTEIEVARSAVKRLVSSLASEVEDARERERKGIVAELRKEQEKERERLEQLRSQSGKIQEELDKAKAEAEGIREKAAKDAEAVKSDIELQRAAIESEKAKTDAAQQALDQEKLKVEMEQKKIEEDLSRIEEERAKLEAERKAAERAIQEQPVMESTPSPTMPQPPNEMVPAPETSAPAPEGSPPVEVPAEPVETPTVPAAPPQQ